MDYIDRLVKLGFKVKTAKIIYMFFADDLDRLRRNIETKEAVLETIA